MLWWHMSVTKKQVQSGTTWHNMWAGVVLKKQDNNRHDEIRQQVVLQHLSASFLNADTGILTIMTDLGPRWHFYWFGVLNISRGESDPGGARDADLDWHEHCKLDDG